MDDYDPTFLRVPLNMITSSQSPVTISPDSGEPSYMGIGTTEQLNLTDRGGGEETFTRPFLPWQEGIIITVLSAIILFSICGNCLVILSVCLDRKLRKTPNILIINLAIADLCVALLVMPFAAANQITGRWRFGRQLCNLYVTFDMLACTASIATLCVISLDRYLVITRPFRYAPKRKPKLMVMFVAIVWFTSVLISTSSFFFGGAHVDNHVCIINQNYIFTIFSTFGAFYLPLVIMITLYFKIFKAAKKSRKADMRQRRGSILFAASRKERRDSRDSNSSKSLHFINQNNVSSNNILSGSNASMLKRNSNDTEESGYVEDENMTPRKRLAVFLQKGRHSLSSLSSARLLLAKEPKAVRTLGVIVGCFTLCWLPFFIVALFRPYCNCIISPTLESVFLWLGYINSTINPVIYPLFNKDFAPAYRKMLSCKCSLNEPREYDDSYWRRERRRSSLGIGSDKESDISVPLNKQISRQSSVQFDDAPQIRKYSLKMDIINCNTNGITNVPPLPSIVKDTVPEQDENSDVVVSEGNSV